ncbi:hypothetical protein [Larkinella arboricola]|nr:hypothetical protein [Larkinella arboricola]
MEDKYNNLRPEKANDFNLDDFKSTVLNLTDFSDQLDLWNKYFDLPAMGRRLSVDVGYKIIFHFYCESPQCAKNFTPEKQAILIEWRKNYYKPFQATFDQLTTYQDRIDFCLKHFGMALNTFVPEEGIIFSTLPETPEEWEIYNRLSYESWEKHLLETPSLKNKAFAIRKKTFTERIINHLYPAKGLQDEIDSIYDEYFQPGKKWTPQTEHINAHIKTFKDRYNGFVLNYAEEPKMHRGFDEMIRYIEGEQAYKYYKYLVELQRMPDWFEELSEKIASLSSLSQHKASIKPSYDVDRLLVDKSYRFAMVDQFSEYMNTIEPYAERVQYFMKISKVLGVGIPALNMGTQNIFERDYWTTDNGEPLNFLDKEGNLVPHKQWGLKVTTDEERRISRKLWFIEVRHSEFKAFGTWINEPLEKRKELYNKQLNNYNSVDLARLHLNIINNEIARFHKEYNGFWDKEPRDSELIEVKRQRLTAPMLIESELLGNRAINWLAFHRGYQLQPFAFLWDMVAFKLFLIQQLHLSQATYTTDLPQISVKNPEIVVIDKSQNFLDEIATVEKKIANNVNDQFRSSLFAPNLYKSVADLWNSLEGKERKETKDLFREAVIGYINDSKLVVDRLIEGYERELRKQPERKAELLIENRDWYVKRLADIYVPIDNWYHNFWDDQAREVKDINALESEVFLFCYNQDKPFMVGLRLLRDLYGYYQAISRFNELIQQNVSGRSIPSIKKKKPAFANNALELYFEHTSKYKIVMELLVERKYCQAGTYIWIDTAPGFKSTVVILIKHLHAQGFFKNKKKPSNQEIVIVAQNTFGVQLSIDSVKKAQPSSSHFDFIKPASTY